MRQIVFCSLKSENSNSFGTALVSAMIAAAKIDGQIDSLVELNVAH